jgi:hypothetical protein
MMKRRSLKLRKEQPKLSPPPVGRDVREAREPVVLESGNLKIGIIGLSDHPAEFAATETSPGIAFADLEGRREKVGI